MGIIIETIFGTYFTGVTYPGSSAIKSYSPELGPSPNASDPITSAPFSAAAIKFLRVCKVYKNGMDVREDWKGEKLLQSGAQHQIRHTNYSANNGASPQVSVHFLTSR